MSNDGDRVPFNPFEGLPKPPGVDIEGFGPLGIPVPVPEGASDQPDVQPQEPEEPSVSEPSDPLDGALEAGESYTEYIERAIEEETCGFCEQVLRDLIDRPVAEQMKGVRELKQLKRVMTADEIPDEDELREMMSDFEVVEMPGL